MGDLHDIFAAHEAEAERAASSPEAIAADEAAAARRKARIGDVDIFDFADDPEEPEGDDETE